MKKKPTKLEMTRRYARLADLMGLQTERKAIRAAATEFGVGTHQVRTYYLPKAREAIEIDIGKSRSQMVREHHHRLNTLYAQADKIGDKLAVLAQLASLHGLDAPSQVAVTVDVLYNPEDQLRAMADPIMLEKVLALDAEFETARLSHENGSGDAGGVPDGEDVDPGPAGVPGSPGLSISPPPPTSPTGGNGAVAKPKPEAPDR